jgi:hypothetical protein
VLEFVLRRFDELAADPVRAPTFDITISGANTPFRITVSDVVYADDLTIVSSTLQGLQHKVDLVNMALTTADLSVNADKSVLLELGPQAVAPAATWQQLHDLKMRFNCVSCQRGFPTNNARTSHQSNCPRRLCASHLLSKEDGPNYQIARPFGPEWHRFYLLRHTPTDTTEVYHAMDLHGVTWDRMRSAYWSNINLQEWIDTGRPTHTTENGTLADTIPTLETGLYLSHPHDTDRCKWCGRTDKREHPRGYCEHTFTPPQPCSTSQRAFTAAWDKAQRAQRTPLTVGEKRVESRAHIKVLGRLQRGDGDDAMDINARMGRARATLRQLQPVWKSKRLTPHQKHLLYFSLVATVVIYGCELWDLTPDITKTLTKFNNKALIKVNQQAHGHRWHKEIKWDLVGYIHFRRLIFVGHLFRTEPTPTTSNPSDTPHTSFRLLLTHVKQPPLSLLTRNSDAPLSTPITSTAGGANPHSVDFPIDASATYTKGTLMELLPQTTTFAQLMRTMRPRSVLRDKQAQYWKAQVEIILTAKFPHFAMPKKQI